MTDTGTIKGPSVRLTLVDGLRGYALMGLFLVHMTGYFELYNARPTPSWVQDATRILFQGKSFSLLALCFGFSFFAIMEGAARRGQPFAARFAWRMAVLAAMGWCHSLIYRGDIILVLAVAGLALIPLDRVRSSRVLLAIAAVLLAQPFLLVRILAGYLHYEWAWADPLFYDDGGAMAPSLHGSFGALVRANLVAGGTSKWSFFIETGRIFQILGLFLIGLVVGRAGFFAAPERFVRTRWWALAIAILAIEPLSIARVHSCCYSHGPIYWTNVLLSGWSDLADMTVSLLLFVLLWQGWLRPLLAAFVPCGRLTLTLYIGQSLVFVPVFYGFGLHLWDRITQEQALLLGIVAFLAQLALAHWWLRRFAYGPLEWLWRSATLLSRDVPFRRRAEPLKAAAR
ncbi:DUF418 domain-containing protein [Sphingomonas nostoxanthinifaciens]|uniref:DUF418 domain-containing protein n=1 Tax=Sphingomonas nostoxanthinifaciens TaxID=2872652 RepID=UPI001CC1FF05|nr:DUF418 domain-containing protein [Sphingomonas nostoxanthinifaciens]UAK24156.1 DUF418 domain-containing protein [Sphingomonas nostoxanthinifaciens]